MVAGGAVSQMDPDSAGLNPAWRKAGLHSVWAGGWPEGTSADGINAVATLVKQRLDIANKLIPNGGAYFNEVCCDFAQSEWTTQSAFLGIFV